MTHTPGPWVARGSRVYLSGNAGGFDLSDCPNPQANACLIAAAPDLLAELEQQADGAAMMAALMAGQGGPIAASMSQMLAFQEANARAVIAKAEGGAP